MATVIVLSLSQFVAKTEEFHDRSGLVLFRGQSVKGNLLPGIARRDPKEDTTENEKKLLKQLSLQGASLLANVGSSDLDLLVAAQHYGLKTRLLDWSTNPLAALWFACNDRSNGDVYVYALEADSLLEEDVYSKNPFTTARTSVIQARLNNARINAQNGWFTLHRYSKSSGRFVALDRNPNAVKHLHQFKVPATRCAELLKSLDRHGVCARTLLPDLAGLCQHLNWRHELA